MRLSENKCVWESSVDSLRGCDAEAESDDVEVLWDCNVFMIW